MESRKRYMVIGCFRPITDSAPVNKSVPFLIVVGDESDLDVQDQGTELAAEADFLCSEGADVSHDVFLLSG